MGKYTWLLFVLGAVLTWGAYVVTIDQGRSKLAAGLPPERSAVAAMRAFLFIGLAYCVMGVVVPVVYLMLNRVADGSDPGFNLRGSVLSTIAGILGAAGALCIVFAVGQARRSGIGMAPALVAPLVFAFAPIVNCLISLAIEPPAERPSWKFFLGMVLAAVGAGLVLFNKPKPAPHAAPVVKVQSPVPGPGPV
jgi:hypothetical protein